jgi:dihydrofolate synthase/folylpolyglutamate synthase
MRTDDLAAWLAHAERLHPSAIDMGLERVAAVRDAFGLAPDFVVITVAGTNGKGSTCALLDAVLREAGYVVGSYMSPHLVRYNERVRIDGVPVGDAALAAAFARVDAARGDIPLTPFEFGTLAAMVLFCEAGLDAAVLEVGLGGRLDAVNAFDADCAVLTGVGIDHVEYLGSTRESIGREKAGVFRAHKPAVCADPDPPACIAEEARRVGARLLQSGRDYALQSDDATWSLRLPDGELLRELPRPALVGDVQLHNAAAALVALHALGPRLPVDDAARRAGLANVQLAGRFQRIRRDDVAPEILLDVAHNPQAAERLAQMIDAHPVRGRTIALFAMLRDKDIAGTARALGGRVDEWCVAGIEHERRGATAAELAAALDAAGVAVPVQRCPSVAEALGDALARATPDDRVLVFGSFVTVGAVMRQLDRRARRPLRAA